MLVSPVVTLAGSREKPLFNTRESMYIAYKMQTYWALNTFYAVGH